MGKRQHQKDKMYLTYTEWSQFYGGKKTASAENEAIKFKRLPFDHCALSFVPFEHPYCDKDGHVFELEPILDFIKTFKVNPATGEPMSSSDLIKLKFYENHEEKDEKSSAYHCPCLFKPFTKNSHIVAIATTGNVFSYEAIEQLNIKTKNWKDLVDDTPFTRKDIITIQDPEHLEKYNISNYHHVKKNLRVMTEDEKAERKDPQGRLKTISMETKEILSQLEKDYKAPEQMLVEQKKADKFNAAHYSTGAVAASFTSTSMNRGLVNEAAIVDDDTIRYERVKKKGYVRLVTNLGALNLELYCDTVPKTCENFLKHCASGYYDGCKFHRSIRNFMVQGGDPTGTGSGGRSIWGGKFDDEFKPNLQHSGRGVLSMANSGPNTNGSQFFITYRSCKHLDGKHTIFGKLVGGVEVLTEIERIEVDNKDGPVENITIERVQVFVDPYQEADEQLAKERADHLEALLKEEQEERKKKEKPKLTVFRTGVGKYLDTRKPNSTETPALLAGEPLRKKKATYNFGSFSGW